MARTNEPLPSQLELRRRLRAARLLEDLTIEALAERIPPEAKMGERVIRKLENGETVLKPQTLRELAAALEYPYSWFTVKRIADILPTDEVDRRYAQFERDFNKRIEELRREIRRDLSEDHEHNGEDPQPAPKRRSPRGILPG